MASLSNPAKICGPLSYQSACGAPIGSFPTRKKRQRSWPTVAGWPMLAKGFNPSSRPLVRLHDLRFRGIIVGRPKAKLDEKVIISVGQDPSWSFPAERYV